MGGKSATGSSTTTVPPQVLANYQSAVNKMSTASDTPFQSYSSDPSSFVAQLNPTEQAGVAGTNAAAQSAQPAYQKAEQMTGNAYANTAQPAFQQGEAMTAAGSGAANLGQLDPTAYMSPYLNTVAKTTEQLQNQSNQQQQAGQLGSAISSGAFGGDRAGIAAANLEQQQNLGNSATIANLMNQGYNTSLATAQQQQGAQLGAQQANLAREMQGGAQMAQLGQGAEQAKLGAAGQLAQLGQGAQSAGLQGAQAQLTAGQLGQQTDQAGLSALYNQFLQQQAYPFQTAQAYANVAEGTGSLSGQSTTTQQPLGLFGGLLSDRRAKEDIRKVGKANNGLAIYKFKYKDDPHNITHIGFMADEVEDKHPEAVGESHGLKTVDYDRATRAAGGLVASQFDPNIGVYGFGGGELPGRGGYVPNSGQQIHHMLTPNQVPMGTGQNNIQQLSNDFGAAKSLWGDANGAYKWAQGLASGGTPYSGEGDDDLVYGNSNNPEHPGSLLNSVVLSGDKTPQQLKAAQTNPAASAKAGGLGALASDIGMFSTLGKAASAFPGLGAAADAVGSAASGVGSAAASGIGDALSFLPFLATGGAARRRRFDDGGDAGPGGGPGGPGGEGNGEGPGMGAAGDGSDGSGDNGDTGDSSTFGGLSDPTAADAMSNMGLAMGLAQATNQVGTQAGEALGLSPSQTEPAGMTVGEFGSMIGGLLGNNPSSVSSQNAVSQDAPASPAKSTMRASNADGSFGPAFGANDPGTVIGGQDAAPTGMTDPSIQAMSQTYGIAPTIGAEAPTPSPVNPSTPPSALAALRAAMTPNSPASDPASTPSPDAQSATALGPASEAPSPSVATAPSQQAAPAPNDPTEASPSMFGSALAAAKSYATNVANNLGQQFGGGDNGDNGQSTPANGHSSGLMSPALKKALMLSNAVPTAKKGGRIGRADGGLLSDGTVDPTLGGASGSWEPDATQDPARLALEYARQMPQPRGGVAPPAVPVAAKAAPPVASGQPIDAAWSGQSAADNRPSAEPDPRNYDPSDNTSAAKYIRDYAAYKGVPQNVAMGVAQAEGLNAYGPKNPNGASSVDIDPNTGKPFSYGDFQLNVRNGLGVEAQKAGIDPTDPAQRFTADKFAIDHMAQPNGLSPWRSDPFVQAYQGGLGSATAQGPSRQVAPSSQPQPQGGGLMNALSGLFGGGSNGGTASQGGPGTPYQPGQGERTTMALLSALGKAAETPGMGPGAVVGALMRGAGGFGDAYMKYPQEAANTGLTQSQIGETQQRANLIGAQTGETQATTGKIGAETQSEMNNIERSSLGYVQGMGPVMWVKDPASGRNIPMTVSEYNRMKNNGQAPPLAYGASQTAIPTGPISPAAAIGSPNAAAPVASAPLPLGVRYDGPAKATAQSDDLSQGGMYDENKQASLANRTAANQDAVAAQNIQPYTQELGKALSKGIAEGSFNAPGFGSAVRGNVVNALNTMSRMNGGPDNAFGNLDTGEQLAAKINALQGQMRQEGGGSQSLSALHTLISANPNFEQNPEASSTILAQLMTDQMKANDRLGFYNKYSEDSNGSLVKAPQEFNRTNGVDYYNRERDQIKTLILNQPKYFSNLVSGKFNQDQIAQSMVKHELSPDLARAFATKGEQP